MQRSSVVLLGGEAARGLQRAADDVGRVCGSHGAAGSLQTPGPGGEVENLSVNNCVELENHNV